MDPDYTTYMITLTKSGNDLFTWYWTVKTPTGKYVGNGSTWTERCAKRHAERAARRDAATTRPTTYAYKV